MKIVWSATAIDDLAGLRAYIAQENPTAASDLARTILDSIELLGEFPAMGRPGRVPHTRELVVTGTPIVIPYRVTAGRVEIIAVLHGAQRWPPRPEDSKK
jgi:toxin ParE1/3/4